jgi:hypothetical protein
MFRTKAKYLCRSYSKLSKQQYRSHIHKEIGTIQQYYQRTPHEYKSKNFMVRTTYYIYKNVGSNKRDAIGEINDVNQYDALRAFYNTDKYLDDLYNNDCSQTVNGKLLMDDTPDDNLIEKHFDTTYGISSNLKNY